MSLLDTASLIVTPNGYKEGKLYSVIPSDGSGDMSVTRATTATRVNAAGLVELVPYNLVQYSEQFDNAYWLKQQGGVAIAPVVTANVELAPNGTLTADRIVFNLNSGTTFADFSQLSSAPFTYNSDTRTQSIYLRTTDNTTKVFTYVSPTGSQTLITVTQNWERFTFTSIGAGANNVRLRLRGTEGTATSASVAVWGAQFVEGTSALDYQATETRLNIPRLDYSNGSCPSLLVEPQRTNLFAFSEQFDDILWIKQLSTISANSTTSPSGVNNADKLIPNTSNAFHPVTQARVVTNGVTYSFSVYAKAAGYNFLLLNTVQGSASGNVGPIINLTNGTIAGNLGGNNYNAKTTSVGNGWYRIDFSYVVSGVTTSIDINPLPSSTISAYSGDGTSGIFLWGAQLEAGAYATSYIPTTSASVTRNADVISKTGISSLIGQTEGTFVFKANVVQPIGLGVQILLTASNDSESQLFIICYVANDGRIAFDFYIGSSYSFSLISASSILSGVNIIGVVYKAGAYKLYINGFQVASSTNSSPITNTISKLSMSSGVAPMYYDFLNVWKTALTNAQLAQLTTI